MFQLATADGILLDFMIYQGNIEASLINHHDKIGCKENESHSL